MVQKRNRAIRSFAGTALSFANSTLFASLARSFIRSLASSPGSDLMVGYQAVLNHSVVTAQRLRLTRFGVLPGLLPDFRFGTAETVFGEELWIP